MLHPGNLLITECRVSLRLERRRGYPQQGKACAYQAVSSSEGFSLYLTVEIDEVLFLSGKGSGFKEGWSLMQL